MIVKSAGPALVESAMTSDEEKELAEAVLRTRRWAFRQAFPEILGVVRQIVSGHEARCDERQRGTERMIRDYREIISLLEGRPPA